MLYLTRNLTLIAIFVACLTCIIAASVPLYLRLSLAQLDGTSTVTGLVQPVTIERDRLGVPTISGSNRLDLAFATGFVHAQERYFQMDTLRRTAAGELAELVGPPGVSADLANRPYQFRARAISALHALPTFQRELLESYARGANAGLAALRVRPFEYIILRANPQPWRPEDSLLVIYSMYLQLQQDQLSRKLARGWIRDHSTEAQTAFLIPEFGATEVPLDKATSIAAATTIPHDAPTWFDVTCTRHLASMPYGPPVGSNSWAVSGRRTTDGRAIVENDMHLPLMLPNMWYRVRLRYPGIRAPSHDITGLTIPGTPVVVAGSNREVAWGLTNSYGAYLDLIPVARDTRDPSRFRQAHIWKTAERHVEIIRIHGHDPVSMTIWSSARSVILEFGGQPFLVHWTAEEADAVNAELVDMEAAHNVQDGEAVANRAGIPGQNILLADNRGDIGWTIAGTLPARDTTYDTRFPNSPEQADRWGGIRQANDYPRIDDPAGGILWSANNRQLDGPEYRKIGDGGADLSARAIQIRAALDAMRDPDERQLYNLSLDNRAVFMSAWRERALQVLDDAALEGHPAREEFRNLLRSSWNGTADPQSIGYRLARAYMLAIYSELFGQLDQKLSELDQHASFAIATPRWPDVIASLLDHEPPGWIRAHRTWHDVKLDAVDLAIERLTLEGRPLGEATWGARNVAAIAHPFARILPLGKLWLSAPTYSLAGDDYMPRVASPSFGASERMVVSPGHEESGLFNLAGGQSGNPISPFFLTEYEAWYRGAATPLLPGPTRYKLVLEPLAPARSSTYQSLGHLDANQNTATP